MRMSLHSCRAAIHFLKSKPTLLYSLSNFSRPFLSLFSAVSSPTQASPEQISIVDHLCTNFKFSKAQSIFISKRVSLARSPQQPLHVLDFFKQIGFSEVQIQSAVCRRPQILFLHVDKILKPKIAYFQQLGFEGSDLGKLLSRHSHLLTYSLNKTLVPFLETLRKIAYSKEDFMKVFHRSWFWRIPNHRVVLHNAAFFESCGIVGSQLSMLLKRHFRLFTASESLLQTLVSRAVSMGFHVNSRMLVHAIVAISSISTRTFNRKFELLRSCGFSEGEIMLMFRRAPLLVHVSEKKLKFGIEVFLDTIMLPKSLLVQKPVLLMFSMEERVIPRCSVLQLLMSKNLVKKNQSIVRVLVLPEKIFLEKYISKFKDDAEALLVAYRSHNLKHPST